MVVAAFVTLSSISIGVILGVVSHFRRASRVLVACLCAFLSLPALAFGIYFAFCSIRLHITNVYYVEYPYALTALILLTIASLNLLCAGYATFRRSYYGGIFIAPIALGLATMVYIPDGMPHIQRSMVSDTNYLSDVGSFLRSWYETHQSFPKDQTEFLAALNEGRHHRIWP